MKIYEWKEDITPEEAENGAYWERNMLALHVAVVENHRCKASGQKITCGWYYDTDNDWDGWKRVISLYDGIITYHIPDDFDIGKLEQIEPNWDGHTTKQKYAMMMFTCGCKTDLEE
jgi:hypothetical protein